VARLTAAEQKGDMDSVAGIQREIALAASQTRSSTEPSASRVLNLSSDVVQSVRESVALLSTVHRTDVRTLQPDGDGRGLGTLLERLGIKTLEFVEDLPVITAVFGYSRRSPDPEYEEERAAQKFPTTLRSFPTLDDDAARVLGRPQAVGTTP